MIISLRLAVSLFAKFIKKGNSILDNTMFQVNGEDDYYKKSYKERLKKILLSKRSKN